MVADVPRFIAGAYHDAGRALCARALNYTVERFIYL
jgi:hypothetical protein